MANEMMCWPPPDICNDCCAQAVAQLDPARWQSIQDQAAYFLWVATGRQYGGCEVTYRPCYQGCGGVGGLPTPVRVDGQWINLSCDRCDRGCSCSFVSEIIIPDTGEVTSVRVDGVELDPATTVVVYDRERIVRVDGEAWPTCQDLSTPTGEVGAWSVTVRHGKMLPPGADVMAGLLACELAKACTGDGTCRLPKRVQTISREGVTMVFPEFNDLINDLQTGIWEVDAWIEAAKRQPRKAIIGSPDIVKPSVQTWPVYPVVVP